MASLYVTEYAEAGGVSGGVVPVAKVPENTVQKLTISGSSGASSAFGSNTYMIRVHTDAICSVAFGSAPTATSGSTRMVAGQTEYFFVKPGHKIAVISNT